MKYALGDIPPRWHLFCQYHPFADGSHLDDRGFGTDEQLAFILFAINNGRELDPQAVERLSQNRSRKHRRHRKILKEKFALPQFLTTDDDAAFASAVSNDDVDWVKRNTSDDEWNCLWSLANGQTYKELADAMKEAVGTLKARVSRCRERLVALRFAA